MDHPRCPIGYIPTTANPFNIDHIVEIVSETAFETVGGAVRHYVGPGTVSDAIDRAQRQRADLYRRRDTGSGDIYAGERLHPVASHGGAQIRY